MIVKYQKDQYVIYNGLQVCRIGDVVKKCFDGVIEKEYYTLFPTDAKSTYYVPSDKIEENVRPILTKERLFEIIDRLPYTESEWIADRNNCKHCKNYKFLSEFFNHSVSSSAYPTPRIVLIERGAFISASFFRMPEIVTQTMLTSTSLSQPQICSIR